MATAICWKCGKFAITSDIVFNRNKGQFQHINCEHTVLNELNSIWKSH